MIQQRTSRGALFMLNAKKKESGHGHGHVYGGLSASGGVPPGASPHRREAC